MRVRVLVRRRLWWAGLLRHPATTAALFALLMLVAVAALGVLPLVQALTGAKHPHLLLHAVNGLLLVGLLGFLLMLVQACTGSQACSDLQQTCHCHGCLYMGACDGGLCDCAAATAGGGGAECGPCLLVLLGAAAAAGLLYGGAVAFMALYGLLASQVGRARELVENVAAAGDGEPRAPTPLLPMPRAAALWGPRPAGGAASA